MIEPGSIKRFYAPGEIALHCGAARLPAKVAHRWSARVFAVGTKNSVRIAVFQAAGIGPGAAFARMPTVLLFTVPLVQYQPMNALTALEVPGRSASS